MWPFKKKTQQASDNTDGSRDCVFKSIMADLEGLNLTDWEFTYENYKWEYFKNRKKDYSVVCQSRFSQAWLSGIDDSFFTPSQRRTLYKKCQELWLVGQEAKKVAEKIEDEKKLKSLFPKCFN